MYLGLLGSGIFSVIEPPILIESQATAVVTSVWAFLMVGSAAGCLYGSVSDRWIGEYSALPLLFSSLGYFGFTVLISAFERDSVPVLAYALTILAFTSGLVARWRDVQVIKSQAVELGRTSRGE